MQAIRMFFFSFFCDEGQLSTLQNVKTPMLYVLVFFHMFLLCWYVVFNTVAGREPSVWTKISFL